MAGVPGLVAGRESVNVLLPASLRDRFGGALSHPPFSVRLPETASSFVSQLTQVPRVAGTFRGHRLRICKQDFQQLFMSVSSLRTACVNAACHERSFLQPAGAASSVPWELPRCRRPCWGLPRERLREGKEAPLLRLARSEPAPLTFPWRTNRLSGYLRSFTFTVPKIG